MHDQCICISHHLNKWDHPHHTPGILVLLQTVSLNNKNRRKKKREWKKWIDTRKHERIKRTEEFTNDFLPSAQRSIIRWYPPVVGWLLSSNMYLSKHKDQHLSSFERKVFVLLLKTNFKSLMSIFLSLSLISHRAWFSSWRARLFSSMFKCEVFCFFKVDSLGFSTSDFRFFPHCDSICLSSLVWICCCNNSWSFQRRFSYPKLIFV